MLLITRDSGQPMLQEISWSVGITDVTLIRATFPTFSSRIRESSELRARIFPILGSDASDSQNGAFAAQFSSQ
jgi:hypothetical protein